MGRLFKTVLYSCLVVAAYHSVSGGRQKDWMLSTSTGTTTSAKTAGAVVQRKLASGWDEAGWKYYNDRQRLLIETEKTNPSFAINLANQGETTVSAIVNNNANFWNFLNGRAAWEPRTFRIFSKYVTADTIVVDFGCWIGPTILYHGQLSKHSYGIEADPVAFAVAEYNVALNQDKAWGSHVTVESACVSAPQHVGAMTMRGAKEPGRSMSGITETLARRFNGEWQVQCYTLPSILDTWGVKLTDQPVMLKIDVESYECKLVPSFYDWLKNYQPEHLPTMYITFHPEITDCTPQEWADVLKVFQLYKHVNAVGDGVPLPVTPSTTQEEFQAMKAKVNWRRDSTFVVSNKEDNAIV